MLKSNRTLTLDVGASKLVVAEFATTRGGTPELVKYGMGDLGLGAEGENVSSAYVVSAIREVMREQGIRPAPLLMTLSGQSVFPRYVKLPPVTRDKVAQIVQYEAEQNVPFPIEEVVWDYQLIGAQDGELNVMLVAVKIENITRLTDCVHAANLEPEIVDVSPMALYNCVRFNYPDLDGCSMVLDIGARSSNLIFVEESRIFSRSIPVAGNAITQEVMKELDVPFEEAEELKKEYAFVAFGGVYAGPESETADRISKITRNVITRLHAEVNRSVNFYRSQQGGQPPRLVLLTGGSSIIPHTDTFFKEKLNANVEYLNPFVNVPVSPSIDAEAIQGDIHLLAAVSGLALRRSLACPVEINLMPPDIVARKQFRRRQPYFALAAVGLVLIMLCWWVYARRMQGMRKEQLAAVNSRIGEFVGVEKELKAAVSERGRVQTRIDMLREVIGLRTRWLEIVESAHGCMLDGMWLTSVKPVRQDNMITDVDISGRGFEDKLRKVDRADAEAIEVFRDRLRACAAFTDKSDVTVRPPPGPEGYDRGFTIRVTLKDPIKLR